MVGDNRAVVAAPAVPGGFELRSVDEPEPRPNEAIVDVDAVSLNRGEVRNLLAAPDGSPHAAPNLGHLLVLVSVGRARKETPFAQQVRPRCRP